MEDDIKMDLVEAGRLCTKIIFFPGSDQRRALVNMAIL
jgi:hypothetical protein